MIGNLLIRCLDSRTTDLAELVTGELKCIQDLADDKNLVFELREVLSGGKATEELEMLMRTRSI